MDIMDKDWGNVFVLDLRPIEEIATDYPLPERFLSNVSCHFQIDKGNQEERTQNLQSAISEICRVANNTIITLHIMGHGVVPDENSKDSIGVQFLKWDEFSAIIGIAQSKSNPYSCALFIMYWCPPATANCMRLMPISSVTCGSAPNSISLSNTATDP